MPAVGLAGRLDLYWYPGTTLAVALVWLDDAGVAVDLTGWTARATIRHKRDDAAVLKVWELGAITLGGPDGTIEFGADEAETLTWEAWPVLAGWDIVLTDANGDAQPPLLEGVVMRRDPFTR